MSPRAKRLGRRLLDGVAGNLAPGRARRGEHAHVLEAVLCEQAEGDRADGARAADDADARCRGPSLSG